MCQGSPTDAFTTAHHANYKFHHPGCCSTHCRVPLVAEPPHPLSLSLSLYVYTFSFIKLVQMHDSVTEAPTRHARKGATHYWCSAEAQAACTTKSQPEHVPSASLGLTHNDRQQQVVDTISLKEAGHAFLPAFQFAVSELSHQAFLVDRAPRTVPVEHFHRLRLHSLPLGRDGSANLSSQSG